MARLIALVETSGQTVFARIDHGAGATQVGLALRPTQLLLFGNPKGGTPLMQNRQTIGIDLPLKILVWEADDGQVWLTYNDPAWLAQRHNLGAASEAAVKAMSAGIGKMAAAAVKG
jgi:uncharacterized protein (DUF302 family)